jgi:L-ascorbate metabolism protein UlaG (beta-lactamase superfamily)
VKKSPEGLKSWAREHLRWFGQSAFQLRTEGGVSVFIDPFRVPAAAGPADIILITHPHSDHYDRKSIAGLSNPGTTIVMPRSCAEPGQSALSAGQSVTFGRVGVTAVAAYNVRKKFHPRAGGWLGYVVDADGVRLYHAGDTDLIPEMNDLHPDIALLPIGGLFAMNGRAAKEASAALGATLCIPMHFGMLLAGRGAGRRFVQDLGEGGLVLPRAEKP